MFEANEEIVVKNGSLSIWHAHTLAALPGISIRRPQKSGRGPFVPPTASTISRDFSWTAPVRSNFFPACGLAFQFCLFSLSAARLGAEWSLDRWNELGSLEGGAVAWEGKASTDGRTIRADGVSFRSADCLFQVIDNPPDDRRSLPSALAARGGVAGSNGGYFHKDFTPLGLAVSQGKTIHPFERARLLSGVLAVRQGRIELVRSGRFKPGADVQEALQAGPWLVEQGAPVAGS